MSVAERPGIALVVPLLEGGGGVPAVADFIATAIERSQRFRLKLVSLAMASNDPVSLRLAAPGTWLAGVRHSGGTWRGREFVHVGASLTEFEWRRYQGRDALRKVVGDCDLIQVVCGSPAWGLSVSGLGRPLAIQCATRAAVERRVRDGNGRGLKAAWRRFMTRITDRMDDRALRVADAVQVENPWMFDYARQLNGGRDALIRYAPPGVDAQRFAPLPVRDLATDPYILCVARLDDPRKRVELLLEAYALLPAQVRGRVRLVLAGAAGPGEAFWRRAQALGVQDRVSYTGPLDEAALIACYRGASVFALASDEEGLGVVLLEAMACGVPAVSTRSGGPDGIISDGVDGYLVPLDDAGAMARRLGQLLEDEGLNLGMGAAARQTIMRRYESEVAGQAFLDIYDELLARKR